MIVDLVERYVAVVDHLVLLDLHDAAINADKTGLLSQEHVLLDSVADDIDARVRDRAAIHDQRALKLKVYDHDLHMTVLPELILNNHCLYLGLKIVQKPRVILNVYKRCLLRLEIVAVHILIYIGGMLLNQLLKVIPVI